MEKTSNEREFISQPVRKIDCGSGDQSTQVGGGRISEAAHRAPGMIAGTYVALCHRCQGDGFFRTCGNFEKCAICDGVGVLTVSGQRHGDAVKRNAVKRNAVAKDLGNMALYLGIVLLAVAGLCLLVLWKANAL